jgi:hypothetical protein
LENPKSIEDRRKSARQSQTRERKSSLTVDQALSRRPRVIRDSFDGQVGIVASGDCQVSEQLARGHKNKGSLRKFEIFPDDLENFSGAG